MLWMWNALKRFDYQSVVGHELLCDKLRSSVASGKTLSAYLFSGPAGIGKKTLALPFAASLLCESPKNGGACLACPSCKLLAADSHPDLIRVRVPSDKKTIGVEQVREEILQEAFVRPFSSSRKVFLIEEGEAMTAEAQNALLKVLEEPPAYVCFLILTKAQNQLLETVRSRCLKLQLLPLSDSACKQYFAALPEGSAERKALAGTFSQGNLGQGRKMLTDEAYYELYTETVDGICGLLEHREGLVEMQQFLVNRKDSIDDIIDFMLVFFRDCLRGAISQAPQLICIDRAAEVSACGGRIAPGGIVRIMEALIRFRERLARNASHVAACLELLTQIQEEIHDQGNRSPF